MNRYFGATVFPFVGESSPLPVALATSHARVVYRLIASVPVKRYRVCTCVVLRYRCRPTRKSRFRTPCRDCRLRFATTATVHTCTKRGGECCLVGGPFFSANSFCKKRFWFRRTYRPDQRSFGGPRSTSTTPPLAITADFADDRATFWPFVQTLTWPPI